MRSVEVRLAACALGVGLLLACSSEAIAQTQSKGVPDAPAPVEKVVARHDGFVLPKGFQTANHRRLPKGIYDLALIESGGRFFIQLINKETRKGLRVAAEASGTLEEALRSAADVRVTIQTHKGKDSLLFKCGGFSAALALLDGRNAG